MCWRGQKRNMKIAKKDIHVYKILRRFENEGKARYKGPYMNFFYEIGRCYYTSLGITTFPYSSTISIDEGYHSFSEDVYVKLLNCGLLTIYTKNSCGTLFSVSLGPGLLTMGTPVLVECTIPKGATYYENSDGEIVSNRIIVNCDLGTPNNTTLTKIKEIT